MHTLQETPPRPHATTAMPRVVSQEEWDLARAQLMLHEKAVTHAEDEAAAARRQLPMVRIEGDWTFDSPSGERLSLLDLFEGRRQLVLYHHMLQPDDEHPCPGCSGWGDGVGNLARLHFHDVTLAMTSVAPQDQIDAYAERMGWTLPFYSSAGSTFAQDVNPSPWGPGSFAVSVFLRDGTDVYRTYATWGRGAEKLVFGATMLDITPFGRQETWERSPEGWPQARTYTRGGLKDEFSDDDLSGATSPSSTGEVANAADAAGD